MLCWTIGRRQDALQASARVSHPPGVSPRVSRSLPVPAALSGAERLSEAARQTRDREYSKWRSGQLQLLSHLHRATVEMVERPDLSPRDPSIRRWRGCRRDRPQGVAGVNDNGAVRHRITRGTCGEAAEAEDGKEDAGNH